MLDVLTKIFAAKTTSLQTKLIGVDGFTGAGAVDYSSYATGNSDIGIKVRGIAGLKAALHVNGKHLIDFELNNGRAHHFADTRHGAVLPPLTEGDEVAIHQNGDAVLKGVLVNA